MKLLLTASVAVLALSLCETTLARSADPAPSDVVCGRRVVSRLSSPHRAFSSGGCCGDTRHRLHRERLPYPGKVPRKGFRLRDGTAVPHDLAPVDHADCLERVCFVPGVG